MTNINIISFFIGKILKKFPFFRETLAALLFIIKDFRCVFGLLADFHSPSWLFPFCNLANGQLQVYGNIVI